MTSEQYKCVFSAARCFTDIVCVWGGGGGGGMPPSPPRTACYRALMIVKKYTPDHSLRNGLEGWQRAHNDNLLTIAPPPPPPHQNNN